MSDNTSQQYHRGFRWLHWVMAVLVITMLLAGQRFEMGLPEDEHLMSLAAHSSLGAVFILLLCIRLFMRITGKASRPRLTVTSIHKHAASIVQAMLYLLMVYVPATGILAARFSELPVKVFGLFNIASGDPVVFEQVRRFHEVGVWLLFIFLGLHIAAALMHRYVYRDEVFLTMRLGKRRE